MKSSQIHILHPFLFAAYPVVALLANNIEEIKVVSALRAFIFSILITAVIYWVFNLIIGDKHKAGLITSLFIILFFSYGHVYNYMKIIDPFEFSLGRHRFLSPIWILLLIVGIWIITGWKGTIRGSTRILNFIAVIALVFPFLQISNFGLRSFIAPYLESEQDEIASSLRLPKNNPTPDIYYIILDAYARDDTLFEKYGYDNRPFLNELERLGFFVAQCARSNYAQTNLSLASSLNLDYLQNLSEQFKPGNSSRVGISDLIHHSAVRKALSDLGYEIIAFETGFKVTQLEDADNYLSPQESPLGKAGLLGGLNGFEKLLLEVSAGRLLTDGTILLPGFLQPNLNNPNLIHRNRIEYSFKQLEVLPKQPNPKFVFAHLVIPHPPYVFGPNGETIDFEKPDDPGYQDQIIYLNKLLVPLLEKLIHQSDTQPIIILQADHGAIHAEPNDRMNILNAYYLPMGGDEEVYDSITPVNTFRLIFNQFFEGEFNLLEDTSYFSVYKKPYEFTIMNDVREGCP